MPSPARSGDETTEPSSEEPTPETPSDSEDGESGEKAEDEEAPRPWYRRSLDAVHGALSRSIEGTAQTVDGFFATPQTLEETTDSRIELTYDASWIEAQGDNHEFEVDARLDLPGTEERLQLVVEQDPSSGPQAGSEDPDQAPENDGSDTAEDQDLSVAIEALLEAGRDVRWKIRPALGMQGGLPLNPFTRLRAIRRDSYGKWDSRLAITPTYFYQEGFRFRADKDFDRRLTDNLLFRSRSSYGWDRQPDIETFQQSLNLYQTLTPRRRLAYQVGASTTDQPAWGVRQYYGRLRYRQRVYQHWLFAELQPRIHWPEAANYGPEYGLLFRLEAVFDEKSLRRSRGEVSKR